MDRGSSAEDEAILGDARDGERSQGKAEKSERIRTSTTKQMIRDTESFAIPDYDAVKSHIGSTKHGSFSQRASKFHKMKSMQRENYSGIKSSYKFTKQKGHKRQSSSISKRRSSGNISQTPTLKRVSRRTNRISSFRPKQGDR